MKSLTALVLMMKWARFDLVYCDGVTNFIEVDDMMLEVIKTINEEVISFNISGVA